MIYWAGLDFRLILTQYKNVLSVKSINLRSPRISSVMETLLADSTTWGPFFLENTMWETIDGYPSYQISDTGQVRSLKYGRIRYLKLSDNGHGYAGVSLFENGKQEHFSVHLLVLITFKGPCPQGKECNHRNGIKADNRIVNLEYVTRSENELHAARTGLKFQKPAQQFTKSGQFIAGYRSANEASHQTGVYQGNISACCRGIRKLAGGFVWRFV